MSDTERREMLQRLTDQTLLFRAPASIAIYGIEREGAAMLHGNGTLIQHDGSLAVLTALHVFTNAQRFQYLGMHGGDAEPPRRLLIHNQISNPEADVTAVKLLVPDAVPHWQTRAVPLEQVLNSTLERSGDALYFHGYPETGSTGTGPWGEIHSSLIGYLTAKEREGGAYFAVSFSQFHFEDGPGDWTVGLPPGWSGSACWSLGQGNFGNEWDPARSQFAGVVTSWAVESYLIWVSRGEHAQQVLRELFEVP